MGKIPEDAEVTPGLVARHGLTPDEYRLIQDILGREPTITELGIFSVMWSEHCSYKSSRPELKKFPTEGPSVLVRAGEENAGVIDIGDGWAVAFKIESHNHPSAVEPFQGAATGVGGILRDIFTMGARPVLLADSLRFGDIRGRSRKAAENRRLLNGVVCGIAHYGNCIGVPTVAGEIAFDDSYSGNPLVNVFCLGVLRHDQIRLGKATGEGNPVFYVGAKTGRDGLAGAAFASRDLTEESKEDRPAVQVGDPFREKLLLEACLELFEHAESIVGVQDMGAAGLTCSTCETASRGHSGVEIDLDLVPQREAGMTAYELMLSESQERMLIIARRGHEATVRRIFAKWDLDAVEIGRVTTDGLMRVRHLGRVVAEIPARRLAEEAPVYHREAREPKAEIEDYDPQKFPAPKDLGASLVKMLEVPTVASKRWVYEQYDHMVRVGTVVLPGSDAAVVRVPTDPPGALPPVGERSFKYLAVSTDCNGVHCALDPHEGGKLAVAEAARNLACSGARPIGVTDNLNFGNPQRPDIFWQLRRAVEGVAEGCRVFGVPVTGGNVSLYNESPAGAVDPTPVVGMVGIIDDPAHITTQYFKGAGDAVLLVGCIGGGLGGSLFAKEILGRRLGPCPMVDLAVERATHEALLEMIRRGWVRSAHDCSEGGLGVALAECCMSGPREPLGAEIDLALAGASPGRLDEVLFNEAPGRVVVSVPEGHSGAALALMAERGVAAHRIGRTGGDVLRIIASDASILWQVARLREAWGGALGRLLRG
ncbi:MAG TPA: phosphoribosylformylglycinamidine synthase subunit PurL [Verrucomicrobiae bacterium]|mgnify:CR=1 FL=1|nr:phosphoribosylformylglycinamidine synthase subunit PurL [Verrucomicrobiae bacterium]